MNPTIYLVAFYAFEIHAAMFLHQDNARTEINVTRTDHAACQVPKTTPLITFTCMNFGGLLMAVPDGSVVTTSMSGSYNVQIHDLEVMGSNPGLVKLQVHSTSVCVTLDPNVSIKIR